MKKLWILIIACLLEFAPAFAYANTAGMAAGMAAATAAYSAMRQREKREHEELYHDELNLIDKGVVSEGLVVRCTKTKNDETKQAYVMYTVCEVFHQEWRYPCDTHKAHYKRWEEFRRPATTYEITTFLKHRKIMYISRIVMAIGSCAICGLIIYRVKSDNLRGGNKCKSKLNLKII